MSVYFLGESVPIHCGFPEGVVYFYFFFMGVNRLLQGNFILVKGGCGQDCIETLSADLLINYRSVLVTLSMFSS